MLNKKTALAFFLLITLLFLSSCKHELTKEESDMLEQFRNNKIEYYIRSTENSAQICGVYEELQLRRLIIAEELYILALDNKKVLDFIKRSDFSVDEIENGSGNWRDYDIRSIARKIQSKAKSLSGNVCYKVPSKIQMKIFEGCKRAYNQYKADGEMTPDAVFFASCMTMRFRSYQDKGEAFFTFTTKDGRVENVTIK